MKFKILENTNNKSYELEINGIKLLMSYNEIVGIKAGSYLLRTTKPGTHTRTTSRHVNNYINNVYRLSGGVIDIKHELFNYILDLIEVNKKGAAAEAVLKILEDAGKEI